MPNWLVQLTGEKFDLEDLPNCFTAPELKVVEEFDSYYLKSELFDLLQDANEVRVLAEELRDRMVGAAKLARSNFQSVDLGAVIRREEDGKRNVYLFPETPDWLLEKLKHLPDSRSHQLGIAQRLCLSVCLCLSPLEPAMLPVKPKRSLLLSPRPFRRLLAVELSSNPAF